MRSHDDFGARADFPLFCLVLARECPTLTPRQILDHATELRRMARALERLNVKQCNEQWTMREQFRYERWEDRSKAYVAANLHGVTVKLGHDPRGYAVKLLLPSGVYNTMGGKEEGWGVPVS